MSQKIFGSNPNSAALSIGFTIMAAIIIFSFIGYKLDQKFKTSYWTLIGVFVGFSYSGYEVWKLIRNLKEEEKNKAQKKD